jgi:large subunit ribosomal protein L29
MPQKKARDFRTLTEEDLVEKLISDKLEYSQVTSNLQRGLVKENQGKVKPLRKEIARINTILNELRRNSSVD